MYVNLVIHNSTIATYSYHSTAIVYSHPQKDAEACKLLNIEIYIYIYSIYKTYIDICIYMVLIGNFTSIFLNHDDMVVRIEVVQTVRLHREINELMLMHISSMALRC